MSLVPAGGPLRLNLTAPLGSGVQGALVAHPAAATGCAAGSLAQLHGVLGSGLSTRGEDAGALSSSAVVGWCTTRTERSREEQQLWGFHGSQRAVHDYSEQGCALVGLCLSMCEVRVRAGGVCDL